jgi:ATP/maltotriose-dependent transcriptional regulator MalT
LLSFLALSSRPRAEDISTAGASASLFRGVEWQAVFKTSRISQADRNKTLNGYRRALSPCQLITGGHLASNVSFTRKDVPPNLMFLIDSSHDLTSGRSQLITDKIAQPTGRPRISRSRLINTLERSLGAGTSTIISGRAGTGKSMLALDFAERCGRRVAWYKVDAPDSDPRIFFDYLIGSVREQRPGFGAKLLQPLVGSADFDRIDELAEVFIYELGDSDQHEPLLIVIEDLHLVCDSEWLVPFLTRLLPLLPADVHMLITSRSMPPAPLWRLRSKQSLVVIEEEALAFTRPEAIALFESYGLSSEQASIVLDHSHGRAVALDEFATFLRNSEAKTNGQSRALSVAALPEQFV